MDYWKLVWLVLMLGGGVVGPVIVLIVAARGLGDGTLSEKQRQAGEKELREARIVRDGEEWERRDLDELMLNLRRYEQWKRIGMAAIFLLTGGVGMVALIVVAGGMVQEDVYTTAALGILGGSLTLGMGVGYYMSDRRFSARVSELPMPQPEAIFSGAGGVLRLPWWLRVFDAGLTVGVSFVTLLYALGRGGTLENATTHAVIARHPWLIWCIPVALYVIMAAQELLVRWGLRRPPLRLSEQVELAGRADQYRRREVCKELYELTVFPWPLSIAWLSMNQLMTFGGLAGFSIEFPLYDIAFGGWIVGALAYGMAESRRKRRGQGAGDAGLRGGGEVA